MWALGLAGLVAAMAISILVPQTFAARTRLLIDPNALVVLGGDDAPSPRTHAIDVARVDNEARKMTSPLLLGRVAQQIARAGASAADALPTGDALRDAVATLRRSVTAAREPGTFVIALDVAARDPDQSIAISEAIVTAYAQQFGGAGVGPAPSARAPKLDALRERLAELAALIAAERSAAGLSRDSAASGANAPTDDRAALTKRRVQFAKAAVGVHRARAAAAARAVRDPETASLTIETADLAVRRKALADVRRRKSELEKALKPRHPAMQAVIEEERVALRQVRADLRATAAEAETQANLARARLRAAERARASAAATKPKTPAVTPKISELETRLAALRTTLDGLTKADVAAPEVPSVAALPSVTRLSGPALADGIGFPPPPGLLLPLGFLLGIGAGAGVALLRGTGDALAAAPMSSAADPPAVVADTGPMAEIAWPAERGESGAAYLRHRLGGGGIYRVNGAAQPLTTLIGAMAAARPIDRPPRIIAVSAEPDAGDAAASAVALSLGDAAQADGRRVLIVDADLSRRRLSQAAAAARRNGTIEVMRDGAPLAAAIVASAPGGPDFLPLISSDHTVAAVTDADLARLAEAAQHYDVVIVDHPGATGGAALEAVDVVRVVRRGASHDLADAGRAKHVAGVIVLGDSARA